MGTVSQRLTYGVHHSFAGGVVDGSKPEFVAPLVIGSTLYGTASEGGANGKGTLFQINTDGTGYALVRSFAGGTSDGAAPFGSLIASGSTLYGTTSGGGSSDSGTVFKVETNGTGFALLHTFVGGAADGTVPYGTLVLSGATLYGMTTFGGTADLGTVFKVNADGSGFTLLHSFAGGTADGASPTGGALLVSGSTLYGTTSRGGQVSSGLGTLFKVNTDGTGFALLHVFAGGTSDGALPYGPMIASGTTLYGTTVSGGSAADAGTVFKIEMNGTGFALLHSFVGGTADGASPYGALLLSGSTFHATTHSGGAFNQGTVFSMNTEGTGFALVHSFAGGVTDGRHPFGSLAASGSALYGVTTTGGSANLGTVFKVGLPCAADEHVATNVCVACAAGSTHAAGDDPAGPDTACTATACALNQHVSNHTCVPCASGSTRPAGDLATGPDTSCTASPTDAGVPPTDAGVPPTDAGVPPTDAGVSPTDAGVSPIDAGVSPTDAGVSPPPSSSPTPSPPSNNGADASSAVTDPADADAGCACRAFGVRSRSRGAGAAAVVAFAVLTLAALRRRGARAA